VAAAWTANRFAPWPAAEVGRGSEDPFVSGLHAREIPPGRGPQRWTAEQALIRFRNLPSGPADLEVRLHGHRGAVAVAVDGVLVGRLEPGTSSARWTLRPSVASAHQVELRAETFLAGDGRRLGALLDGVVWRHPRAGWPPWGLILAFLGPALAALAAARLAGLGPWWAAGLSAGVAALTLALLLPSGLLRSGYALSLPWLLTLGLLAAGGLARWTARRQPGTAGWALLALLTAFLVQGILATSPVMVVSDAVFHANNLGRVASGDLLLTSSTQHVRPFRFPYGVAFYALLAPLQRLGGDGVTLVRWGAAAAGLLASWALLSLLLPSGPARAALAVAALQLLPGVFDVYSFGNLSNVFGQAMTVLFFVWWAGRGWGGWPVGASLLALGCLSHFSALTVLGALCAVLVGVRGRELRGDKPRLAALAVGLGLAAAYYAQFAGLMASQLPRLLEGGGQGRGVSRTAWDVLRLQGLSVLGEWGGPALLLAILGRPRPSRGGLDRDLTAFWIAGGILAATAVVSPLDVRYLYALTPCLAVAAAEGAVAGWSRGALWRLAIVVLGAAQLTLACRAWLEAVFVRYRG
jgi:hypothetical protein